MKTKLMHLFNLSILTFPTKGACNFKSNQTEISYNSRIIGLCCTSPTRKLEEKMLGAFPKVLFHVLLMRTK